jgi:hypothetical protein
MPRTHGRGVGQATPPAVELVTFDGAGIEEVLCGTTRTLSRFAMDHPARHRPRVLYPGLGETDDWAHDGRYDRVLEAFARRDEYLKQL